VSRGAYYDNLRALAQEKRTAFGVNTVAFGMREVRRIYNAEGVRIDYWPLPYKIKALYMCDDGDCSVAVQRRLPDEPKIFALVHELKHHYRDRPALGNGLVHCGDYDANELIEKGAEVFAAEFIYPEDDFSHDIEQLQRKDWTPQDVVQFRRNCGIKVSYQFICKRLEWQGIIKPRQFRGVQFQKLEFQMFGAPFRRKRGGGGAITLRTEP
jgi:Zn-dependent peptidase ImmA (M78 family)